MAGDARRHPRYETAILKSTLGDVMNLSGGGARLRCTGKTTAAPGQVVQLTIHSNEQKLRVTARILRVQRRGFRSHEIGLAFVDLKPGLAAVLEGFARFGFIAPSAGNAGQAAATPPWAAEQPGQAPPVSDKSRKRVLRAILEVPNPYEQLEVAPTATDEDIKAAYRRIARSCHPDVNQGPEAAARFIACTQAYELLVDPEARRFYDLEAAKRSAA